MELWIATSNKGKLSEFQILLSKINHEIETDKNLPLEIRIHSLQEIPHYSLPSENGKSFYENAMIKAKSLRAMKPQQWILAEDSGLVVDLLGGLPGIHSARYAGAKASDQENVAKLLKMIQLKGGGSSGGNGSGGGGSGSGGLAKQQTISTVKAHFECVMVVYDPQGVEYVFKGEMSGEISKVPRGREGFGYDPVFVPDVDPTKRTLAELGISFKNRHSHRAKATLSFLDYLRKERR